MRSHSAPISGAAREPRHFVSLEVKVVEGGDHEVHQVLSPRPVELAPEVAAAEPVLH
jgi:hypothetical protein